MAQPLLVIIESSKPENFQTIFHTIPTNKQATCILYLTPYKWDKETKMMPYK